MIFGIGIDMEVVSHVPRSIFTEDERRGRSLESLAGKWAAKEALCKALGGRPHFGFILTAVEVLEDQVGKPYFKINQDWLEKLLTWANIQLSISHTAGFAVAMVVIDIQGPAKDFQDHLNKIVEEEFNVKRSEAEGQQGTATATVATGVGEKGESGATGYYTGTDKRANW